MRPLEKEKVLSYQEQGSIGSDPALSISTWRKKIMGCLHFHSHVPVSPSMMDHWTHWISKGKTRPLPRQQGIFSKHQLWSQRFIIYLSEAHLVFLVKSIHVGFLFLLRNDRSRERCSSGFAVWSLVHIYHFVVFLKPLHRGVSIIVRYTISVCRLSRLTKVHYSKNGVGQNENPLVNGLQLAP